MGVKRGSSFYQPYYHECATQVCTEIQIHQVQIVKSGSATAAVPPYLAEIINLPKFTISSGGVDYCLGMAPPVIGSSLHLGWQYDVINSL